MFKLHTEKYILHSSKSINFYNILRKENKFFFYVHDEMKFSKICDEYILRLLSGKYFLIRVEYNRYT